jgi:hypothetical protein
MKTIKCKCDFCSNEFEKPLNEYKRQSERGRTLFYCSRKCSGNRPDNKNKLKNLGLGHAPFKGGLNKLVTPDEIALGGLKEFSRRIRRRKQFDKELSPNNLLEIWNTQNGKCAYTNVQLILPCSSDYNESNNNFKASIDRIDSNKPYSIDNIQFTSITVNYLKNNMIESDITQFFNIIKG